MKIPKFVSLATGAEVSKTTMKTRVFAIDFAGVLWEFNFSEKRWEQLSCDIVNLD